MPSIIDNNAEKERDPNAQPPPEVMNAIRSDPNAPPNRLTNLSRVDPNNYYNANRDAGSVLGNDMEKALWGIANGSPGSGGGGGGAAPQIGVSDRSPEFMQFQDDTTQYMSNLMKGAGDQAEGMFGQGVLNQMTSDNNQIVQTQLQKLQEQFKGNVNHPAFIQAKNDLMSTSRMFNQRAFTDLLQKAGQYGIEVGKMATSYYDTYSTKEEDQQKLKLAADQFNAEMVMKKRQMAASAANARAGQQLAALAAISANRKFEANIGLQASTTELEARVADHVTNLNIQLENKKLSVAQEIAAKQRKSDLINGLLGFAGKVLGGLAGA